MRLTKPIIENQKGAFIISFDRLHEGPRSHLVALGQVRIAHDFVVAEHKEGTFNADSWAVDGRAS